MCIGSVNCLRCVGASPLEVSTALMGAGSWGLVHEPAASGPLNADVLDNTNNVLVNTAMFHAVTFHPEDLQVRVSPLCVRVCACALLCSLCVSLLFPVSMSMCVCVCVCLCL